MKCTSPLLAVWYQPGYEESGLVDLQRPLVVGRYTDQYNSMTPADVLHTPPWTNQHLRYLQLPCGHCIACRLNKSQEWSYRCLMESLYHDRNCFLTLTVDDVMMPDVFPGRSLCYPPFQNFLKRLRQKLDHPVRFLMCGEYGDQLQRPHYHCLLFGEDFSGDRYLWRAMPYPLYRSPLLESVWTDGYSTIGAMTADTISYVCRYVMKKINGALASGHYGDKLPEFMRSSNRPGIGAQFLKDYVGQDFYKRGLDGQWYNDFCLFNERKMKLPRYYDKLFARLNNDDFVSLRQYRLTMGSDVFDVRDCDLARSADYLSVVTTMSHNKGGNHV